MTRTKKLRLIEFLAIGVLMGLGEDLIAVTVSTGERITWDIVWIVLPVAVVFAFISEIVVDHPKFWEKFLPEKKA
jgi:hypothetical protein